MRCGEEASEKRGRRREREERVAKRGAKEELLRLLRLLRVTGRAQQKRAEWAHKMAKLRRLCVTGRPKRPYSKERKALLPAFWVRSRKECERSGVQKKMLLRVPPSLLNSLCSIHHANPIPTYSPLRYGVKARAAVGASVSTSDMVSDGVVLADYFRTGRTGFAHALLAMICANMLVQLIITGIQAHGLKKGRAKKAS